MKILVALSSSLVSLVGCASNPQSSALPFFPQVAPPPPGLNETWLTAAFDGKVVIEKDCVKVRSAGQRHGTTVLWYSAIELGRDPNGFFLREVSGQRILVRFNDPTYFGGGEASNEFINRAYPEVARRCGPPYAFGYPANITDAP